MAKKKRGIYADPKGTTAANLDDKVADFAYENDVLAQLIVDAWTGTLVLTSGTYTARSSAAKAALEARGLYLAEPIVITEDEYDTGFSLADAGLSPTNGVVFVLPRQSRATAGKPLLETAKMLMAVTPNGI